MVVHEVVQHRLVELPKDTGQVALELSLATFAAEGGKAGAGGGGGQEEEEGRQEGGGHAVDELAVAELPLVAERAMVELAVDAHRYKAQTRAGCAHGGWARSGSHSSRAGTRTCWDTCRTG